MGALVEIVGPYTPKMSLMAVFFLPYDTIFFAICFATCILENAGISCVEIFQTEL